MSTRNDHRGLERVALLNEAAKQLISRSFQVNLLALDAMVQSKRGGSQLRGFDEVSSQMRSWSRDLHLHLERLAALSRQVVVGTSVATKEGRLVGFLAHAARLSQHAGIAATHENRVARQEQREREQARDWRSVLELLSDLDQLGMMAVVLSRSAMIEASGGTAELRAQLSHVSQEFYRNSEAVVLVLKALIKSMQAISHP